MSWLALFTPSDAGVGQPGVVVVECPTRASVDVVRAQLASALPWPGGDPTYGGPATLRMIVDTGSDPIVNVTDDQDRGMTPASWIDADGAAVVYTTADAILST